MTHLENLDRSRALLRHREWENYLNLIYQSKMKAEADMLAKIQLARTTPVKRDKSAKLCFKKAGYSSVETSDMDYGMDESTLEHLVDSDDGEFH